MRLKYLILVASVYSNVLLAQEAPNFNNSIPGSTDANAVSKEINIPVNYFTGTPNISIPIYSYQRNSLSTSVSLNYFAGGNRVDEQATCVGLGWRVNAGGLITRELRGLPDDCPGRGYLFTPEVKPGPKTGRLATLYDYSAYGKDWIDSEFDIFQFNAGGRTGSFVIGKNGKVELIPQQNIKITWSSGSVAGASLSSIKDFTITLEDGTKYVFNVPEVTTKDKVTEYDFNKGYVSSWYLRYIIAPFNEDTIAFSYADVRTSRSLPAPTTKFDFPGEATQTFNSSSLVTVDAKYLSRISFPYDVNLDFIYDAAERADAKGEYALNRIELRDTILRTGYSFEYQYFSDQGIDYPYGSNNTSISKLKLHKLYKYTQFRKLKPYVFTYAFNRVPKAGNAGQDHWGFFNNKSNADLVPAVGSLSGANREPDGQYAKAGVLTGINYPEGAATSFEYESNDRNTFFYLEKQTAVIGSTDYYPQSITINISKFSATPFTLNYSLYYFRGSGCPVIITLKNAAGQVLDQFETDGTNQYLTKTYALSSGAYTVSWSPTSCGTSNIPECTIAWVNELKDLTYALSGGIRIKKIISKDSLNPGTLIVRNFSYKNIDGTSSGFAFYKPRYDYLFTVYPRVGGKREYTARISAPLNNLDYIWGAPVGYSRVEESTSGNGKTVYEFSTFQDVNYFPVTPQFPFAAKLYPFWQIGLPKKIVVFDQAGKPLAITENNYKFYTKSFGYPDTAYKSVKMNSYSQSYASDGTLVSTGYAQDIYYLATGRSELDSTTEKMISGSDTSLMQTKYTYDTLYNPVSIRKWVSKDLQKFIQTNIYYPYNYNVSGALKQLKDSGITIPVATENWIKTPAGESLQDATIAGYEVVNGKSIKHKYTYGLLANSPVPLATIGTFNGAVLNRNTALIPLVKTVDRFDNEFAPVETTINLTGERQSVIWDNVFQTNLAVVNNAGFNEIAYTSFEGNTNGNWTVPTGNFWYSDAMTGKRSFILSGTIATTVAAGKEYVVTYWSKGNAAGVNGVAGTKLISHRGWNCYMHVLPATTTTISVTGNALTLDELRAYPRSARMTTNTVEFHVGTTSTCNEYNRITYYEYDDLGRIILVKDEDKNILDMYCYGLANERVNCNVIYKNNEISRKFVQTNCTNGKPDTVLYTVNAGKYTSLVSQYSADSTAMMDVLQNGQSYANTKGTCGVFYAKLAYENIDSYGNLDVVVRFYADEACTIPKSVSNVPVTVGVTDNCATSTGDYTATANGTYSVVVPNALYYYTYTECDYGSWPCYDYECWVDYYLKPGPYTIK
jgi:hypothetical protein